MPLLQCNRLGATVVAVPARRAHGEKRVASHVLPFLWQGSAPVSRRALVARNFYPSGIYIFLLAKLYSRDPLAYSSSLAQVGRYNGSIRRSIFLGLSRPMPDAGANLTIRSSGRLRVGCGSLSGIAAAAA